MQRTHIDQPPLPPRKKIHRTRETVFNSQHNANMTDIKYFDLTANRGRGKVSRFFGSC